VPNSKTRLGQLLDADTPCVLLCAGKDCYGKSSSATKKLEAAAANAGLDVGRVRCQGSCKGPTAVVPTADGPRWFEALASPRARHDLIAFASSRDTPTERLGKRELRGKRKKKAAKKLAGQLA